MRMIEKQMDLFDLPSNTYLAHCISADYALGAGIAVQFEKRFKLRDELKRVGDGSYPTCIQIDKVFNLVTKGCCRDKPSYFNLSRALVELREQVIEKDIKLLAIPKLGCGLDRLKWELVKDMIEDMFEDLDINILVCYL